MAYPATVLPNPLGQGVELVDGEPVLFRATLSKRWKKWRCVNCTLAGSLPGGGVGFLAWGLWYAACGGSCRDEELRSHDLVLTPTAVHLTQKLYGCGCCCQSTTKKTVPLEKVQDVALVADCCGDCCGYSEAPGKPYQLHIQTAGTSGADGTAEMAVFCLEDIEDLRIRILNAKRALGGLAPMPLMHHPVMVAGAGKDAPPLATPASPSSVGGGGAGVHFTAPGVVTTMPPAVAVFGSDTRQAVAVLERIEAALAEAVALMRAREAREAAAGGAGEGK